MDGLPRSSIPIVPSSVSSSGIPSLAHDGIMPFKFFSEIGSDLLRVNDCPRLSWVEHDLRQSDISSVLVLS